MSDEKLRVLRMLENGTINATQAEELLNALNEEPFPKPVTDEEQPKKPAKWLRILVTNKESGKNKVNLRVPLGIIPWHLMENGLNIKVGDQYKEDNLDLHFDKENIMEVLKKGEPGVIVDVDDEDENEKVLITLE